MNRAQTSAIVLLLASAAAAYEQDAHAHEKVRPVACVDAAMEADGPRLRRLLRALLAWALGREQRVGPELVP